jgi:2,4-dienoyl-CoA reductase-like NADH-dependent reductase (Old Yellow Enzyme family)
MPVFLLISATDWLGNVEGIDGWTVEDTIKLDEILAERGVDLIDVSTGGNHPKQQIKTGPGISSKSLIFQQGTLTASELTYLQAPFAQKVKDKIGDKMLVAAVGSVMSGKLANGLLEKGLDMAAAGRMFQKNPGLVWAWAEEIGVEVNLPDQIRWGFGGRQGFKGKRS